MTTPSVQTVRAATVPSTAEPATEPPVGTHVEVVGREVASASPAPGTKVDAVARMASALSAMVGTTEWTLELWDGRTVVASGVERFRITMRCPEAIDRLLGGMPERAFGRAYGDGLIQIEPLEDFLEAVSTSTARAKARAVPTLVRAALALGARPRFGSLKGGEARLRGRRHSRGRDAAAIKHHYDLPLEFYALWLDTSLTYSCAYFTDAANDLDVAERAKLDLVCTKLRLRPGETLLDIGCGWGSLPVHAAREYGVRAVGITLSEAQATHARRRVAELGLDGAVEIRLADYRERLSAKFDAVASIGMLEHVGRRNIRTFVAAVSEALRPGGRALIHGITAREGAPIQRGSFVDAFIFPDGELEDVGYLATMLERGGLEVRDVENLREHYELTARRWGERLDARWAEAESIVGPARMRLWSLYLTGSKVGFRLGNMSVNQILAVKCAENGRSGLPLTRADWYRAGDGTRQGGRGAS